MRASQIYWYLQADEAPPVDECLHHYSHIDAVSRENRSRLNKMRRKRRRMDAFREEEQGDLVTIPDTGPGESSPTGY